MAWGSKITLTGIGSALSDVTNLESDYSAANHYSQWVSLNPGESAHLQIEAAFGGTGNDMLYRVVGTLDDSSESADTLQFVSGTLTFSASVTVRKSIVLRGPYKFRVEVRKGGTTAGSYTPNVYLRKDGVSL